MCSPCISRGLATFNLSGTHRLDCVLPLHLVKSGSSRLLFPFYLLHIMFTADLSWTDAGTEKVGERKERIARERSIHSTTPSVYSYRSSRASSIADERELWWASGFRKAKSLTPMRKGRPSTAQSTGTDKSRRLSNGLHFITSTLDQDPEESSSPPAIPCTSSLTSTVPSGEFLGPPILDGSISELEGDRSSHSSMSSTSSSSHEMPWTQRPPHKVEVVEIRPQMPRSIMVRPSARSLKNAPPPENFRSFSPSFNRRKMCVYFIIGTAS